MRFLAMVNQQFTLSRLPFLLFTYAILYANLHCQITSKCPCSHGSTSRSDLLIAESSTSDRMICSQRHCGSNSHKARHWSQDVSFDDHLTRLRQNYILVSMITWDYFVSVALEFKPNAFLLRQNSRVKVSKSKIVRSYTQHVNIALNQNRPVAQCWFLCCSCSCCCKRTRDDNA